MDEALRRHGVEICSSSLGHRGLCSKSSVSSSSSSSPIILSQLKPLVSIVTTRATCQHCFHHSTDRRRLRSCGLCHSVRYCSRKCQLLDWKNIHSVECKGMQLFMKNTSLSSSSSFGTIRLMYRLLILLLMDKSGNSLLSESITQLMSHTELPSPPDMQGEDIDVFYRQMAQILYQMLECQKQIEVDEEKKKVMMSIDYLLQLMSKVIYNVFTICDEELVPVGLGLYPIASFINHSCNPNAVVGFHHNFMSIRPLIDDIHPGTEITISYVDIAQTVAVRQEILQASYSFFCQCSRCKLESCSKLQRDKTIPLSPAIRSMYDQAQRYSEQMNYPEAWNLLQHVIDSNDTKKNNNTNIHSNWEEVQMLDKITTILIHLEKFQEARKYAERTLDGYISLLPNPLHPVIGLKAFCLGKLESFLGHDVAAQDRLEQALQIIRRTHGSDAKLVSQILFQLHETSKAKKR